MRNIVFVNVKTGMGFNTILDLPFAIFLSYLKQLRIFEIEQTEEGRKALSQSNNLNKTEPDWAKIRNSKGYQKVKSKAKYQGE